MCNATIKDHANILASALRGVLPLADNESMALLGVEKRDGEDCVAEKALEACETAMRALSDFDKDCGEIGAVVHHTTHWTTTLPVLSTAHITADVDASLENRSIEKLISASYEGGHFLNVEAATWVGESLPQCLIDICAYAKQHNFTWIRLDRDGDLADGLPTFEW